MSLSYQQDLGQTENKSPIKDGCYRPSLQDGKGVNLGGSNTTENGTIWDRSRYDAHRVFR